MKRIHHFSIFKKPTASIASLMMLINLIPNIAFGQTSTNLPPQHPWSSTQQLSGINQTNNIKQGIIKSFPDGNGNLEIIYQEEEGYENITPTTDQYRRIMYRKFSNGQWSPPVKLQEYYYQINTSTQDISFNGVEAVKIGDTIHLFYAWQELYSQTGQINYLEIKNGNILTSKQITSTTTKSYHPQITVDSTNKIHLFWRDGYDFKTKTGTSLVHYTSGISKNWNNITSIPNTTPNRWASYLEEQYGAYNFGVNTENDVPIVIYYNDHKFHFTKKTNNGWTTPINIKISHHQSRGTTRTYKGLGNVANSQGQTYIFPKGNDTYDIYYTDSEIGTNSGTQGLDHFELNLTQAIFNQISTDSQDLIGGKSDSYKFVSLMYEIHPIGNGRYHIFDTEENSELPTTRISFFHNIYDGSNLQFRERTITHDIDSNARLIKRFATSVIGDKLAIYSSFRLNNGTNPGIYETLYSEANYNSIFNAKIEPVSPKDKDTQLPTNTQLKWQPNGINFDSYNVFFGEDPNNLYKAASNQTFTTHQLYNLDLNKKYYWQIEGTRNGAIMTSDKWEFTTTTQNTPEITNLIATPDHTNKEITLNWNHSEISVAMNNNSSKFLAMNAQGNTLDKPQKTKEEKIQEKLQKPHNKNNFIVKVKDNLTEKDKKRLQDFLEKEKKQISKITNNNTESNINESQILEIELKEKSEENLKTELTTIINESWVEYAEPNYIWKTNALPNDTSIGQQWGLKNTGQNNGTVGADIDAEKGWDLLKSSPNTLSTVTVAVIDSGVDYNHPDLAANIWSNTQEIPNNQIDDDGNGYVDDIRGYDMNTCANYDQNNNCTQTKPQDNDPLDSDGHGTHVAGIIAAVSNNNQGIAGVSQNTKIMPIQFTYQGLGDTVNAIKAIEYANNNGAQIINASWGAETYSQALKDTITNTESKGILFVAAAGNGGIDEIGDDNDSNPYFPASYTLNSIISVGATDNTDNITVFSNYGKYSVDVFAPGKDIYSTLPNSKYGNKSGTSMATPFVSGIAASLLSQDNQSTFYDIKQNILNNSDYISNLQNKSVTKGRVNLFKSTNDNSDFKHFNVYRSTNLISDINQATKLGTTTIPTYTDATPIPNTPYYYAVTVVNDLNQESEPAITTTPVMVNGSSQPPTNSNIALASQGAKVTGGSDTASNSNLIDGSLTFDATTGFTQTAYDSSTSPLTITLDKKYILNTIKLYLPDDTFNNQYVYRIQTSEDGTNWDTVLDRNKGSHRSWQLAKFNDKNVKYIRILPAWGTSSLFKAVELQAFYDETPTDITTLSKPTSDVALSSLGARLYGGQYPVYIYPTIKNSLAIDGKTDTGAAMQYTPAISPGQEFVLELDKPYNLNTLKLNLHPVPNETYSYTIDISPDGKNWTQVADHSQDTLTGLQTTTFPDSIVKYVRINGADYSYNFLFLSEIEAFNDPNPSANNPVKPAQGQDVALTSQGATISGGSDTASNSNLIDGSLTFDATTGFTQTAYDSSTSPLLIELDKKYILNTIKLYLPDDTFNNQYVYRIQTSEDGTNWDTVLDRNKGSHRSWQLAKFNDKNVKYIRILPAWGTSSLFKAVELQAFYDETPTDITTLSKPTSDVALSSLGARLYGGQYPVYIYPTIKNSLAIDGKTDTGAAMQYTPAISPGQEFVLELDKHYNLNTLKLNLHPVPNETYSYTIETSPDGINWTQVADHSQDTLTGLQTTTFPDSIVKYVRINGADYSYNFLFLSEIEALHTP